MFDYFQFYTTRIYCIRLAGTVYRFFLVHVNTTVQTGYLYIAIIVIASVQLVYKRRVEKVV